MERQQLHIVIVYSLRQIVHSERKEKKFLMVAFLYDRSLGI